LKDAAAKAKKLGTKLRSNVELKILWKQTLVKEKDKSSLVAKKNISSVSKPDFKLEGSSASSVESTVEMATKSKKNPKMINLSEGLPMQITIDELRVILTQPTKNAAERATILDARDKYLRMLKDIKGKSSATISSGTILHGTCMDMCPEKERCEYNMGSLINIQLIDTILNFCRYSREEKRRLASYEILTSSEKVY